MKQKMKVCVCKYMIRSVFPHSMFAGVRITAKVTLLHYMQMQIKSFIKWPLVCLYIHLMPHLLNINTLSPAWSSSEPSCLSFQDHMTFFPA